MKRRNEVMLSDAQILGDSRLFAVLAQPTRVRIIKDLMSGTLTVGELVEKLGMKQGSVSKQLGLLHDANLLTRERDGNFMICDCRSNSRSPLQAGV